MDDADAVRGAGAPRLPRVPAHAWTWLQRSRPVLAEASRRLTGEPPTPGFVEALREQFEQDPFVRDVVVDVVAEVAFAGRVPSHRPPGASWDRGLTWWAAALAGVTPAEFEARAPSVRSTQRPLFDAGEEQAAVAIRGVRPAGGALGPAARRTAERAALARTLRELVAGADGDQVPVSALRQVIEQLES